MTVIVVPVLRRSHRVGPLVASIRAATPQPHRVLFVATAGDTDELAAITEAAAEVVVIPENRHGDYAIKVNTGYAMSDEPFLLQAADDLVFHPGWLAAAMGPMADPKIGVVGTNDLGNRAVMAGRHATHNLVRRSYIDAYGTIDEPGKVLHEGYVHNFSDNELIGTARSRGAWAMALDSHVEHLHPLWGKGPSDEVYAYARSYYERDRRLHDQRRCLWM